MINIVNMHHVCNMIYKYMGIISWNNKRLRIIYDRRMGVKKLYDMDDDTIAVLLINNRQIFNINPNYEKKYIFDPDIILRIINGSDIRALTLDYIILSNSIPVVRWLKRGESFDIIYSYSAQIDNILTLKNSFVAAPSRELYSIRGDNFVYYYDKKNNFILNEEKTFVAILLSKGYNAPRWSTTTYGALNIEKMFDVAKIIQILPGHKLNQKESSAYPMTSIMLYLYIQWVSIYEHFIIYYEPNNGEICRTYNEFRYTA